MYPYPREILADTYLSRLGGFNEEIGKREIGINSKAIELNTSLIVDETKVKLSFMDRKNKPYFLRGFFKVVAVEEHSSAYDLTKFGEVVLGEEHKEKYIRDVNKAVLINAVESFRLDGDYSSMKKAIQSMKDWIWKSESLRRRN